MTRADHLQDRGLVSDGDPATNGNARGKAALGRVPADPAVTLAVHDVTKSYGPRPVLKGVDLELRAGETALVAGANGAGKTTLLRVVAGLIIPDAGRVRIGRLDPERDRRDYQRRVGFISAGDRGLYARLSVRHNLEFWARLALMERLEAQAAIDRSLSRFALEELASRRVDRLSMGQRQRVRLAMAFLHTPQVVLLDEPRTSLDQDGTGLLVAALREHSERSGSAIWCAPTGDPEPLDFDHHYLIEAGKVVEP